MTKCKKKASLLKMKKILREHYSCYILLTCSPPSEEGTMQVHMTYEGEDSLAHYLIEGARNVFEKQTEWIEDLC